MEPSENTHVQLDVGTQSGPLAHLLISSADVEVRVVDQDLLHANFHRFPNQDVHLPGAAVAGAQGHVFLGHVLQNPHSGGIQLTVLVHIDHRGLRHGHLPRTGEMAFVGIDVILTGHSGKVDHLGAHAAGHVHGVQVEQSHGVVYYCNHELLDVYTTDAYTKVICDLVEEKKPEIFLIGATNIGRDLGPRCAARLHTGLTADCTHLDVDVEKYKAFLKTTSTIDVDNTKFEENTNLKMTRPAFGGHLMATIICPRFRPQMSTVRPGVMQTQPYDEAGAAKTVIENVDVKLSKEDIHVEVVEVVKAAKKMVDLIGADVVVSVGRGISKDVEGGIKLAEELAGVLGGVVGSSRAVVDAGWISADHQVGQTGKTVHPRIYVALGISGAIQHLAGMQDSECIIAVNKNETAPIFDVASYGIVGDLYKVTPMLIEAIRSVKASK